MVEQWNRDGATVEQRWWNSATVIMEQRDNEVEQWNSYGGRVEQIWWNSGTMMVEQ